MLVLRSLFAWLLVTVAVTEASNLRLGRRNLQTYTQSDDYISAMLDRVNQARAVEGLPALCTNKKLQEAAQQHSNDQAKHDFMDHTGTDGTSMNERVTQVGYDWSSVAENVAAGQVDVDAVMEAWMNSPGHRENILGDYTMLGCAYAYNADTTYQHYWTQDFGTGDAEGCDGGSVATESTVADLVESSEAEDAPSETETLTTDDAPEMAVTTDLFTENSGAEDTVNETEDAAPEDSAVVMDTPEMATTTDLATESSSYASQESDTPCTDAPVVVVDPPVTSKYPAGYPTEGSEVEEGSAYGETDTPVIVVDHPEIGLPMNTLTGGSEVSTSPETPTIEVPEVTPVAVVDPPEIGTPAPEKVYKSYDTETTATNKPQHGKDCNPKF
jgi:uncharacterized protein YkwD